MPTVRLGRLDSFSVGLWPAFLTVWATVSDNERRRSWNGKAHWDRSFETLGLDLYDVEFSTGTLNVVVTRAGGVDPEALATANRAISEWLDANDPIAGRYTLDVSSPGLERRLRTPRTLQERRGRSRDPARAARRGADVSPRRHLACAATRRPSPSTSANSVR